MPLTNKNGGILRVITSNQDMYKSEGVPPVPFLGMGIVLQKKKLTLNSALNEQKLNFTYIITISESMEYSRNNSASLRLRFVFSL